MCKTVNMATVKSMPEVTMLKTPMSAQMTDMALTLMSLAKGALANPKYPTRDEVATPNVKAPIGTIAPDSTVAPPR